MEVREAARGERTAVATVLDAAMLATADLGAAVADGRVLVAVEGERLLGALVIVDPADAPDWVRERDVDVHIDAVAVRRRRRGQGIGSALVTAAAERVGEGGRLSAAFTPDVRPFYESLEFDVEPADGRLYGTLEPSRR